MCLSFYSLHSRQVEYFNGINVTKRELLRSHLQSEMFNLPIFTLRYYDKEGLFPTMQRDSGIRKFGERELEALRVIECLKKSGLETLDIKQFMAN